MNPVLQRWLPWLSPPSPAAEANDLPTAFTKAVTKTVGKAFALTQPAELKVYECDACLLIKKSPALVVLPATAQEAAVVVQLCHQHNVAYVPRGAGTGLSGGALASQKNSILLGLNRLNRILEINPAERWACVEPGVVNVTLNETLAEHGLFYAPDPSSQAACTIGGNVAENAGGIHCFKHGVTTDHVLGLEWITPDGEVVLLGGPTLIRQGAGVELDWMKLLVGSEGTLGVVTKIWLRLLPKPEQVNLFLVTYAQVSQGAGVVSALVEEGLEPAAIEFLDKVTVQCVNQAFHMGFPEECEALLLIEVSGEAQEVAWETQAVEAVLRRFEPQVLQLATTAEACKALWKARKGTVAAYGRLQPAFYVHDCVIPRSKLTEALAGIHEIGERYNLTIANVFHAGDGNLHPNLLFNPEDTEMVERVYKAGEEILDLCLALGGTLSGEHGIGLEKSEFMDRLFSEADLDVMRLIKYTLDPKNLCNPGKMFPLKTTCGEAGLHLSPDFKTTLNNALAQHNLTERKPFLANPNSPETRLSEDGETGLWI